MLTTWPLTALVVILIVFVLVVLFASVLCHLAMRRGIWFEADIGVASLRFKVRAQNTGHAPSDKTTV
jgi:hypothetical protein